MSALAGGVSVVLIFKLIDEFIELLPTLIAAGANVGKAISTINEVFAEAKVDAGDPRFDEYTARIAEARAKLRARAAELGVAS